MTILWNWHLEQIVLSVSMRCIVDISAILASLNRDYRKDLCIKYSLKLLSVWLDANYHRFFKLYTEAPKMAGYVIDWFIDRERKSALKAMMKAYVYKLNWEYIRYSVVLVILRWIEANVVILIVDTKILSSCSETLSL